MDRSVFLCDFILPHSTTMIIDFAVNRLYSGCGQHLKDFACCEYAIKPTDLVPNQLSENLLIRKILMPFSVSGKDCPRCSKSEGRYEDQKRTITDGTD